MNVLLTTALLILYTLVCRLSLFSKKSAVCVGIFLLTKEFLFSFCNSLFCVSQIWNRKTLFIFLLYGAYQSFPCDLMYAQFWDSLHKHLKVYSISSRCKVRNTPRRYILLILCLVPTFPYSFLPTWLSLDWELVCWSVQILVCFYFYC